VHQDSPVANLLHYLDIGLVVHQDSPS